MSDDDDKLAFKALTKKKKLKTKKKKKIKPLLGVGHSSEGSYI